MVVDTVISIERKLMAMEAILHRDQRTTSHRVVLNLKNLSVAMTTNKTMLRKSINETSQMEKTIIEEGNDLKISHLTNNLLTSKNDRSNNCCAITCHRSCNHHCSIRKNDDVSVHRHYRRNMFRKCINSSPNSNSSWILKNWMILVLIQLIMTSANGAPLKSRRQDSPPMWVNPCGLASEDFTIDPDVEQLNDYELISQIILQTQTALSHTLLFKDAFVQESFKSDFQNLHSQFKAMSYDWLPNFPKQLGEQLNKEHFKNVNMDDTLLGIYKFLQVFAVALEQIVWDQQDYNLPFYKYFRDAELKLRAVLCEVQTALVERAVSLGDDVTREVMAEEFRMIASSATERHLRDFLILRDYMNCLEYINQVCEFIITTLPRS